MHYQQPETFQHVKFNMTDFPINHYSIEDSTTMPHWHNHLEIVHIPKGQVSVFVNGRSYDNSMGEIMFIPGNSLHSIIPRGHGIYHAIVIGDALIESMVQNQGYKELESLAEASISQPIIVKSEDPYYQVLLQSIMIIKNELQDKSTCFQSIVEAQLILFFSYLKRGFPEELTAGTSLSQVSPHALAMKDCLKYLMNHYEEKITIKDMSQQMNITEQHFSRLFKAYTGSTFVNYLTKLRLEEANKLLIHSSLPVTMVPELTGFCNANYFSRVYRKYYGQPPSETRKKIKSDS